MLLSALASEVGGTGLPPVTSVVGGAGFPPLASAVGGARLSPLGSAVGGAGLSPLASTHISYSNTGTLLLWYSILVPSPYIHLDMGHCGDGEERDVLVYVYKLIDQTKQSVFKVPSL